MDHIEFFTALRVVPVYNLCILVSKCFLSDNTIHCRECIRNVSSTNRGKEKGS